MSAKVKELIQSEVVLCQKLNLRFAVEGLAVAGSMPKFHFGYYSSGIWRLV